TRALEWLNAYNEISDSNKITAMMVLEACCRATPTHMYEFLPKILNALRNPLRDTRIKLRDGAAQTLFECMVLLSSRDLVTRNQIYEKMYEDYILDISKYTTEGLHGSLLVCKQLVSHSGMFMENHFNHVVEIILRLREHREFLIRKEVMTLLPMLANYNPSEITKAKGKDKSPMQRLMNYLINQTKRERDQLVAFVAIGKMALATKELYSPYLQTTFVTINDYLIFAQKNKGAVDLSPVFGCIGDIGKALGPVTTSNMKELLGIMLMSGLSKPLCDCLKQLLNIISEILVGKPFYLNDSNQLGLLRNANTNNVSSYAVPPQLVENTSSHSLIAPGLNDVYSFGEPSQNMDEVLLALRTLGTFGFEEQNLSELIRSDVLLYMSSEEPEVRKEAIIAVSQIVSNNQLYWKQIGPGVDLTNEIVQNLIAVSITDSDSQIRLLAVSLFENIGQFDFHLGKAENIGNLLMMLNDKVFNIREIMVTVVSRLTQTNPAHVIPSLRRMIVQLLTQLEYSNISQEKEECIKLLMAAVKSAEQWIKPYVIEILKTVLSNVSDANPRLSSKYLETIGALAPVGREDLIEYSDQIIEIFIQALADQNSLIKRISALKALGQFARHCGVVSKPFEDHPELLEILLSMLKSDESKEIRQEVVKVIGNIGAVDPYIYRQKLNEVKANNPMIQLPNLNKTGNVPIRLVALPPKAGLLDDQIKKDRSLGHKTKPSKTGGNKKSGALGNNDNSALPALGFEVSEIPSDSLGTTFTSEDYHTRMALYSLLKILRDPMLFELHTEACSAILNTFSSLGSLCAKYLKDVVPSLIFAMNVEGNNQKEFYLEQLGRLVLIEKQLIRPYLGEVFELFEEDLGSTQNQQLAAIALIEVVADALEGDFGSHLSTLYRNAPTQKLHNQIMDLFCVLMQQLQDDFVIFMPTIKSATLYCGTERQHVEYDRCSRLLFSNRLAPLETPEQKPTLQSESVINDDPLSRDNNRRSKPNVLALKRAWETSRRITKDDWLDWIKQLSVELLKENPSPALRACALMASRYSQLGEELFNSAFVSCFSEISNSEQKELLDTIDVAASSAQMPPEILQAILNLAEYMERDEKPLPLSLERLGVYAQRCHALAKALHYKEIECGMVGGENVVQDLIILNQQLDQHDAAAGTLEFIRKTRPDLAGRAEWHVRLGQWDKALTVYSTMENGMNGSLFDQQFLGGKSFEFGNESQNLLNVKFASGENKTSQLEVILGKMECYYNLSDWDLLIPLIEKMWNYSDEIKSRVAPIGANLSWALGDISQLEKYLKYLPKDKQTTHFFYALVAVYQNKNEEAHKYIRIAREKIEQEMSAQLSESFLRGYGQAVSCQMLSELEEVIFFKSLKEQPEQQNLIANIWDKRLRGCQRDVSVWQNLIQIRSLALPKTTILSSWLEFAKLCMDSEKMMLCMQILRLLLLDEFDQRNLSIENSTNKNQRASSNWIDVSEPMKWAHSSANLLINSSTVTQITPRLSQIGSGDPVFSNSRLSTGQLLQSNKNVHLANSIKFVEEEINSSSFPELIYTYSEYKWKSGEKPIALETLKKVTESLSIHVGFDFNNLTLDRNVNSSLNKNNYGYESGQTQNYYPNIESLKLLSKLYYKQGQWMLSMFNQHEGTSRLENSMNNNSIAKETYVEALKLYESSKILDKTSYLAWHSWALLHYVMTQASERESGSATGDVVTNHIVPSVYGFFKAIQLSNTDTTLQDTLRLLAVWFNYGHIESVAQAISSKFNDVKVTTWIQVIPQILARIHASHDNVKRLIVQLLVDVGKSHPQAILFSLTVAAKSTLDQRKKVSKSILEKLRNFTPELVAQTEMVSTELVRVAILWAEMWNEALEDASRLYFSKGDYKGMLEKLMPLHALIRQGPETLREVHFVQAFGRELSEAEEWCNQFSESLKTTPNTNYLKHAWEVYYSVFRKIERSLKQMTSLTLKNVSPKLLSSKDLQLAVPGLYSPNKPVVYIQSFRSMLYIYSSKQHPRRLVIIGSDGVAYTFLLKGHEDLRQDERVMQLFDLINNLLNRDSETSRRHLSIERYPVIPLSPNSGLIGFYPDCETLHSLIKSYRESRNIVINAEHRHMLQYAPDYENCSILQKIEAFEYSMGLTQGNDLHKVLWYRSHNAETWLERRTNYTRSLGVMSMAGYILGLGDRHPSNLMIHSASGKVVHIDFGDCFEVATIRDKFPETVPFRLTRMLVKAMEVNGIEGSFKITAQHTMRVLRANRDSLMAVLEAFVYDPLVSWHYLQDRSEEMRKVDSAGSNEFPGNAVPFENQGYGKIGLLKEDDVEEQWQVANPKAIAIINRIQNKLTGRDFNPKVTLDVAGQVENLIYQATLVENLCQCYVGWCAFW
ncbi:hypothetical protein BB559_005414, partial [Furculomyces boomerangus]